MLTLQLARSAYPVGHGSPALGTAEPHADLAGPAIPGGLHRQRLLELAERLAKVQALGGEYARVDFCPELAEQVRRLRAS